MWRVDSCHPRLCAPLHSQHIAIFVILTCVSHSLYTMHNDTYLNILGCHVYDVRVFHGVVLPRFPGGPAGLYLKLMLGVLNKCVHMRYIYLILILVIGP